MITSPYGRIPLKWWTRVGSCPCSHLNLKGGVGVRSVTFSLSLSHVRTEERQTDRQTETHKERQRQRTRKHTHTPRSSGRFWHMQDLTDQSSPVQSSPVHGTSVKRWGNATQGPMLSIALLAVVDTIGPINIRSTCTKPPDWIHSTCEFRATAANDSLPDGHRFLWSQINEWSLSVTRIKLLVRPACVADVWVQCHMLGTCMTDAVQMCETLIYSDLAAGQYYYQYYELLQFTWHTLSNLSISPIFHFFFLTFSAEIMPGA